MTSDGAIPQFTDRMKELTLLLGRQLVRPSVAFGDHTLASQVPYFPYLTIYCYFYYRKRKRLCIIAGNRAPVQPGLLMVTAVPLNHILRG